MKINYKNVLELKKAIPSDLDWLLSMKPSMILSNKLSILKVPAVVLWSLVMLCSPKIDVRT